MRTMKVLPWLAGPPMCNERVKEPYLYISFRNSGSRTQNLFPYQYGNKSYTQKTQGRTHSDPSVIWPPLLRKSEKGKGPYSWRDHLCFPHNALPGPSWHIISVHILIGWMVLCSCVEFLCHLTFLSSLRADSVQLSEYQNGKDWVWIFIS